MAHRGLGGLGPYTGGGLTPLFSLRRELDRLFDDAWSGRESGSSWIPAVDVRETGDGIALDVELPGIKSEDVTVQVDQGVLTISGAKREERNEGEEGRFHTVERRYGTFVRSFTLPQGVNDEEIEAEFDNGVLTIRIPKAALPQPRRIQVGGRRQEVAGGTPTGRQQVSTGRGRREKGSEQDDERRVASEGSSE
ncbi:MAG: Hsp20/alpha crystallin family protein [Gemmatimonadaceae bacterium]